MAQYTRVHHNATNVQDDKKKKLSAKQQLVVYMQLKGDDFITIDNAKNL